MKKGYMPRPSRLRYVQEIQGIDVFGDGTLWRIAFLAEGGLVSGKGGRLEMAPDAKIIAIEPQSPEHFHEVYVREAALKKIRERFAKKKGIPE